MATKMIIAVVFVICFISSHMMNVALAQVDCVDACSTACVQSDPRLESRCNRKCTIRCGPDSEVHEHIG